MKILSTLINLFSANALVMFLPLIVFGAEISFVNINPKNNSGNYRITGTIQQGDFDKFINIAKSKNNRPGSIWISSSGGNVNESIKFGNFANEMLMSCIASEQCNSSCFLIVVGCAERIAAVDIGIHRPFFNNQSFGNLPYTQAQKQYNKLLSTVNAYLEKMAVPKDIIDIMTSVPSDSVNIITSHDFKTKLGERHPAYYEWLKAKCGAMTDKEKNDLETVNAAELYPVVIDWLQSHEADDESMKTLEYSKVKWGEAQNMSEGYREYLVNEKNKLQTCEQLAVRQEADKRWKRYLERKK